MDDNIVPSLFLRKAIDMVIAPRYMNAKRETMIIRIQTQILSDGSSVHDVIIAQHGEAVVIPTEGPVQAADLADRLAGLINDNSVATVERG